MGVSFPFSIKKTCIRKAPHHKRPPYKGIRRGRRLDFRLNIANFLYVSHNKYCTNQADLSLSGKMTSLSYVVRYQLALSNLDKFT